MSCLRCPMVTVAHMRPDLAEFHRFTDLLCPEHFREARASEQHREARKARDANRIFCACGNEMYLRDDRRECERCRLLLGPVPPKHVPQDIAPIVAHAPERMTNAQRHRCYHPGCTLSGVLYAGGSWCGVAHHPPRPYWIQ